jgi:O-antigen/teichoic acid export membrane protein
MYNLLIAKAWERYVIPVSVTATALQAGLIVFLIPRQGINGAVAGMVVMILATAILYIYRLRSELSAVAFDWVVFAFLLATGGWVILRAELGLWERVGVGLCLWAVASANLLLRDREALSRLLWPALARVRP